jgi:hypothetical protein
VTIFDDLEPCTYFGRWQDVLRAVGWLGPGHPFAKDVVPEPVFRAIVQLANDPWQPVAVAGRGACGLCRFSGGPANLAYGGSTVALGAANLFIPADGSTVFVAPSLILHYIDAHEYCPPPVFQEAVLRCPPTRALAYLKEMKARGLIVR